MLLSMSSLDYFQCKSLLPECVVLTMIQKLLLLLLQGMIYFCSNAQRNVLLPNCCSKAANLLFFWCQEKWGMLALFFCIYLHYLCWAERASPRHLCTSMGGTFLQGKKDGGYFCPFYSEGSLGLALKAHSSLGPSSQAWEGLILELFEFFMLFCFLMGSGFPHTHEDILALVCPLWCWLGCVPMLKVKLFPVDYFFDQVLRKLNFITAAMHLDWSRQLILQLDECKIIPHKDKLETNQDTESIFFTCKNGRRYVGFYTAFQPMI